MHHDQEQDQPAGAEPAAPETYLSVRVPEDIAKAWDRWEGAEWRRMQHYGVGQLPPDLRFGVRSADGMCAAHRRAWLDYRNMQFDPITGDRWPGGPGSPFVIIGPNLARVREERRVEWDEKASAQMQLIEKICLSGRSQQCAGDRDDRR